MAKLYQNFYIPQLSLLLSMIFCCNSTVILCENFLPQMLTMLVAVETLTIVFLVTVHFLKMKGSYKDRLFWDNIALISMYLITINDTTKLTLSNGLLALSLGSLFLTSHIIMNVVAWGPWKQDSRQDQGQKKQATKDVPWLLKIAFLFIGNGVAISARFLFLGEEKSIVSMFIGGATMFAVSVVLFYCYYNLLTGEDTESDTQTQNLLQ